ncbi:MAG: phosphoribosylamine--glycine ligase [Bacteroidetes bacterium]|nr:phosphoribosylamine--glycine ligase [Bacteroidota bacterium]
MNILLLGSGGREAAISWKLRQSPLCEKLFIAPGNAGTKAFGENIPLNILDFKTLREFCLQQKIDILWPGGEDSLVAGIFDFFATDPLLAHIIVAGPSKAGAQLEGSKAFSKKFMQRHHIPTASYREFSKANFEEGVEYLKTHELPVVLKADGLAAGKGVIIAQTTEEALQAFQSMIQEEQFGAASQKVVVEAFLEGIELSVFALTDGFGYVLLPEAKDYKRIGEGDTGLNTGGMGAISPVPFADDDFMETVRERIIEPTIKGLKKEQIPYQGFIFFGLIKVKGQPYVIEYNCRMGDPETEVVLPRLKDDLVKLIVDMGNQELARRRVKHLPDAACTVMLVSDGYPGDYEKGKPIKGLENVQDSLLFHAGTKASNTDVLTNGGRVLAITSLAPTLKEALAKSYAHAAQIEYEGNIYRRDIGWEF